LNIYKKLLKKNLKNNNKKGFTLVELLVVIGLLGAIAVIVIAAINPVEQANRARDTRYMTSALELSKAIDRYFVGRSNYPWFDEIGTFNTATFGYTLVDSDGVGLCKADCTTVNHGVLITGSELKPEFVSRDFVGASIASGDAMQVGKEAGVAGAVHVCYTPLSDSAQEKATNDDNVWTLGVNAARTAVADPETDCGVDWGSAGCFTCVPE